MHAMVMTAFAALARNYDVACCLLRFLDLGDLVNLKDAVREWRLLLDGEGVWRRALKVCLIFPTVLAEY